jgi:hypothetical protein
MSNTEKRMAGTLASNQISRLSSLSSPISSDDTAAERDPTQLAKFYLFASFHEVSRGGGYCTISTGCSVMGHRRF